jgi:hypothetical protein
MMIEKEIEPSGCEADEVKGTTPMSIQMKSKGRIGEEIFARLSDLSRSPNQALEPTR